MTTKGGKGFNRNKMGPFKGPDSSHASESKSLRQGFLDVDEMPQSLNTDVGQFLQKWGIEEDSYSLVGVLIKSLEPLVFRPLLIFQGDTRVVLLREEKGSSLLVKTQELRESIYLSPLKIYRAKDSKTLFVREFVSNTLGDVYRMSGGFALERLMSLISATLEGLSLIHATGLSHCHITEWNISAAIENQGCLLDIGVYEDYASREDDIADMAYVCENALNKVRVSKEEFANKRKLQDILAPLLQSMTEEDKSKRPTIDVVKVLFKDLVDMVLYDANEESLDIKKEEIAVDSFVQENVDYVRPSFSVETDFKLNIKKYLIYFLLSILVLATAYKVFQRLGSYDFGSGDFSYQVPVLSLDELKLAWASGVPSKMSDVARQAIYESAERDLAEQVIISPILLDQNNVRLVDASLIRVAFSKEWEPQLSSSDRRFVLALALRELLKDEFPKDLPPLSGLHPAVVLSVLSSTENKIPVILNSVPASILESLPEPFGVAYQILNTGKTDVKASAEEVITLAHLGTRGVDDPVLLARFLKTDFERRLSAIAVMFSTNSVESLKVLDTILNHPNVALNIPATNWAKKVDLVNWNGIDASDKLFLTAGVALRPDKELSIEQIARLFLNPSAKVRGFAAGLSIHQIPFKHKGAIEVLTLVHKVPDIISSYQLTMLGQILEDPNKTMESHIQVIKKFIESEPPIEIAKILLLSNAISNSQNVLDSSLSSYLNEKGWQPDLAELKVLVNHHDKVARMFAYQVIFKSEQRDASLTWLKECITKESDPEFKQQLQFMIDRLGGSSK